MKPALLLPVLLTSLSLGTASLHAAAEVGKAAPDFELKGGDGKTHTLSANKGKVVVLEWTNPECPFVVKFYEPGEMQKLQEKYTGKDVVWYRVNSGAPGKQGAQSAEEIAKYDTEHKVKATASLLDPEGKAGRAYGAKTTPHMYVINKEGVLVYAGGIDDIKSTKAADIAKAKNHVAAAVDEVLEGKAVSTPTSTPYGCGVKYAD